MFPVSIKYEGSIQLGLTENSIDSIFDFFKSELSMAGVEKFEKTNEKLCFRNYFYRLFGNGYYMNLVNCGYIELQREDSEVINVIYSISLAWLLIGASIISLVIGLITKDLKLCILLFCGIYLLQWLFIGLRHKSLFNSMMRNYKYRSHS